MTITLGKTPKIHLISSCGNFVEKHSFRRVSGDSLDENGSSHTVFYTFTLRSGGIINLNFFLVFPKKCPYSEFFWSAFSSNAGKHGPENMDTFHVVFTLFPLLKFGHWHLISNVFCYQRCRVVSCSSKTCFLFNAYTSWLKQKPMLKHVCCISRNVVILIIFYILSIFDLI